MSVQVSGLGAQLRGDVFDTNCPSRAVLDHVTSKWAVLVLAALQDGPMRFSELRRRIGGVSEKMLAQALRTLEGDGFLHREVAPTTPPQVTYSLTPLGDGIAERVVGLADWIAERIPEIQEFRTR
ncbi:winged helix-turn-helix transcriptional regulator [Pseudonocardia sp. CA-107938]|uniref:winged helix-turn-helix transcriptional regulator n=1 Tax=Pseudonocardia sp. CA-107938 TaxID=3240021 RepID=UPI003D93DF16